ncbi:MAG: xanthan lyase [Cyclobacterium sp.]|nr:xanthan lyase [Cyclobacterium sp.]
MINKKNVVVILYFLSFTAVFSQQHDILVYGATPSGIMAAINAGRQGHSVALVEEYPHIGGLMTGGLSFTDFISTEALGGTFNEYRHRVVEYYTEKYGENSLQVKDSYQGVNAEPHVTLHIFKEMLGEIPSVSVYTHHRIIKTETIQSENGDSHIQSAAFQNLKEGKNVVFSASIFIDATYEGDLAALSGAEYRIGRESRDEFCERFAGHIFTKGGQILPGGTGQGDDRVQAYNFRMIMTDSLENSRRIEKPRDYDREKYLPIAEVLKSGKVKQVFTQSAEGILRVQPIPNRKADINDIKNAPVRMSSLGENYEYPEGIPELRQQIISNHRSHILGMIYFLQNDENIPVEIRNESGKWGLAKDEFVDNDNFPYRLYIREARRIMGDVVFTESNTYQAPGSFRSILVEDAVAICDYALNCHGVSAPGPIYPEMTEGDFNFIPQPFQIPYGVMVPKKFDNLLVPVAISSSHVGFNGIRLEPTWSALGQAAGFAAHLSIRDNVPVAKIDVKKLQSLLLENKAKIIYVSDVAPDSPYFEAVQYFGIQGFFHDLYALEEIRIKPRVVHKLQYMDPMEYHDVQPELQLDQSIAYKWLKLVPEGKREKAEALYLERAWTRGDFLNGLLNLCTSDEL